MAEKKTVSDKCNLTAFLSTTVKLNISSW